MLSAMADGPAVSDGQLTGGADGAEVGNGAEAADGTEVGEWRRMERRLNSVFSGRLDAADAEEKYRSMPTAVAEALGQSKGPYRLVSSMPFRCHL